MHPLYYILTYGGIIPFAFGALCFWIGIYELPFIGDVRQALHSYAAIIASFLAGTHWGMSASRETPSLGMSIFSNVTALSAWLCLFAVPADYVPLMIFLLLMALLAGDHILYRQGCVVSSYMAMRRTATTIVCVLLLSIMIKGHLL